MRRGGMKDKARYWQITIDLWCPETLAKRIQRLVATALPRRVIETPESVERNCVKLHAVDV